MSKLEKIHKGQNKGTKNRSKVSLEKLVKAGKPTQFSADNQPENRGRKKKGHSVTPTDLKSIVYEVLAGNEYYVPVYEEGSTPKQMRLEKRSTELTIVELIVNSYIAIIANPDSKDADKINAGDKLMKQLEGAPVDKGVLRQPLVIIQNQQYNAIQDESTAMQKGSNIVMPDEAKVLDVGVNGKSEGE